MNAPCPNTRPVGEPPPPPPSSAAPAILSQPLLISIIAILTFAFVLLTICFCVLLAYFGYRRLLDSIRRVLRRINAELSHNRHHGCCVCQHVCASPELCRNDAYSPHCRVAASSSPLSAVAQRGSEILSPGSPYHPRFNSPASTTSTASYRTGADADRSASEFEDSAPTCAQSARASRTAARTLRRSTRGSLIDEVFEQPSMEWDDYQPSPEVFRDASLEALDQVFNHRDGEYDVYNSTVTDQDVEVHDVGNAEDQGVSEDQRSTSRLLMVGLRPPEYWI